jgi:glycine betaine/proline transport system permease protein
VAEPTAILAAEDGTLPRIPLGDWVDSGIDWLTENIEPAIDAVSTVTEGAVEALTDALLFPPALVLAALLAALGLVARSVVFAVGSLAGLLLIQSMELWEPAMGTLALVLFATLVSVLIAVPLGIAAAKSDRVSAVLRPVLDFMQTMPAFVYLVPGVVFFGLGVVPGTIITIIFALPPGVRLTELGIRQVDRETVEAGQAFGGSPWQILRGIQLPLARPTIMAGINQVIMLGLSMAVIAGFIGAPGLGQVVVTSISRLDVGLGFEGGLAVVILAIYLDRLTATFGGSGQGRRGVLASLAQRRRRPPDATPATAAPATGAAPDRTPEPAGLR